MSLYQRIVSRFPPNLSLVFAYGSGVFPQNDQVPPSSNMLDLILVVRDPYKWHKENLLTNRQDYSVPMRLAGAQKVTDLMENHGAKVYFNTNIHVEDRRIKYGVISEENLVNDLVKWNTLYIAGRLHKPVHIIQHDFENSPQLLDGLKSNLISALLTALLILPDSFNEAQLFQTITALSYAGDFRMKFGEDKNKISNIVHSNLVRFQQLYYPVLESLSETSARIQSPYKSFMFWDKSQKTIEQDKTPLIQHYHLQKLPSELKLRLCRIFDMEARQIRDVEEIIRSAARYPDLSDIIHQSVVNIVQDSSRYQSLKGILTAGLWTSVKYSYNKVKKMFKSMKFKRPKLGPT